MFKHKMIKANWIAVFVICAILIFCVTGCVDDYDGWRQDRGNAELTALVDEPISHRIGLDWKVQLGAPIRFSPIVGYGKVFVGADNHRMYALDPRNGSTLWTYDAGGKISISGAVQRLLGVDYPILWFVAEDGYLYALNAENGQFLWKLEGGGGQWMSPISYRVPKWVFYSTCVSRGPSSKTRGVHAVTGELIWEKSNMPCHATPLVIHHSNILIQGINTGGPNKIRAYQGADGTELWSLQPSLPSNQGALTSGVYSGGWNRLYVSLREGTVGAYNADNQYNLWTISLPSNDLITGFALRQRGQPTAGTLIVTQPKHIYAIEAMTGKIYWHVEHSGNLIDDTTLRTTMPAIYGDFVFHVENRNRLTVRRLDDGENVWNYTLDGPVISSPAVANRTIFIATEAGSIYSFTACEE